MPNLYTDFELFITFDGIYLKLNCTDKTVCNIDKIDSYLHSSGIKMYDKTVVEEALKPFKATTIKIAQATVDFVDENANVIVSDDEMTAYIEFLPPSSNGKAITVEGVKKKLEEAEISVGLEEVDLDGIWDNRSYFIRYEVAKGIPPVEGTPAYVDYKFDTTLSNERKPKVNSDGSVDYHSMDIVNPVKEGDMLAVVIPAVKGEDGLTVTGKPVSPVVQLNEDLTVYAGRNVNLSEDKKEAYAAKDGQVMLSDGRVVVDDMYFVNGDVDTKTGNIAFNGSVVITGNVRAGFKVEANGDIQIDGTVEGAYIHAQNNLLIKGGIQGMSKGAIYAGGNIVSKFIENADVTCAGSIETGTIMYSDVLVKENIEVEDKKGLIIGGRITAGREIRCKRIGTTMGSQTILQVGKYKNMKVAIETTKDSIQEIEKDRLNMLKVIKYFKNRIKDGEELNDEETVELKDLIKKQKKLAKKIESKKEKLDIIETLYKQSERNTDRMICMEQVQQDVQIVINGATVITRQKYNSIKATKHKGDVRLDYYSVEDDEEYIL